jgi:branched-chain amino acid transport system permease protein
VKPVAALLDGVVLGLQYGLLGVGLTLIYGLAGVVNLAHGQIAILGAIVVSLLMSAGWAVVPAALVGILASGLVLLVLDLTLMRAVYRQHGEHRILLGLLLMLGVAFVIDGYLNWKYTIDSLTIRIGGDPVPILGVNMRTGSLLASAITVVAGLALVAFFQYTTLGRGVRSVIQDEEGARLVGVNPSTVRSFVFLLSGLLAGLVAVTRSMTSPTPSSLGIQLTTVALIVAVVGGLGSVSGAFLAGVLLGVVDRFAAAYIGQFYKEVILLLCAAAMIVLRPSGLLGKASR